MVQIFKLMAYISMLVYLLCSVCSGFRIISDRRKFDLRVFQLELIPVAILATSTIGLSITGGFIIYNNQEQIKSLNRNLESEFDSIQKSIAGVEAKINFLFFVIPTAIGLIVGFNAMQEFNRNLATGIEESNRIEEIRTERSNKQKIEAYDQMMLERILN